MKPQTTEAQLLSMIETNGLPAVLRALAIAMDTWADENQNDEYADFEDELEGMASRLDEIW